MSRHWIAAFLDAQAAELGAAENTLAAYARDLADFTDWLDAEGGDLARVTQTQIESVAIGVTPSKETSQLKTTPAKPSRRRSTPRLSSPIDRLLMVSLRR